MDGKTVALKCKILEALALPGSLPRITPSWKQQQRGWLRMGALTRAMLLFHSPMWCQPQTRLWFGGLGRAASSMLQVYTASDQNQSVNRVGNPKSVYQRVKVGRRLWGSAREHVNPCCLTACTPFTLLRSRVGSTVLSVMQLGGGK